MAIKEVAPKDESLEDLLQSIGNRKKKAKNRQSFSDESTEDSEQEKKASIKRKKSYNSNHLKVASVVAIIGLCGAWYIYTSIPSVYDAIMCFIRELFPPVTGSAGIEYYVD